MNAEHLFDMDDLRQLLDIDAAAGVTVAADAFTGFTRREKKAVLEEIISRFGPTSLCLAVCGIETPNHPGLKACQHTLDAVKNRSEKVLCLCRGEDLIPVCALPLQLHHRGHFCCPDDHRRYKVCPDCSNAVPVRAMKRHVEAHLGVNRKSPEELKADIKRDVCAYLRLNGNDHAASMVEAGRWNASGSWVRGITKKYGATNIKEMRKCISEQAEASA